MSTFISVSFMIYSYMVIYVILKYIVEKNNKYKTIREVLKNEFKISSRLLTKLRSNKKVLLNGFSTYFDKEINFNDIVEVYLNYDEDNSNIVPNKIPLDIIYEDESFIVINKPAGIAIHPSCLHYDTSLSNGVKYYFDKIGLKKKIRPVNRLDKDTSGLVIFAKNEYIQECLVRQMNSALFYKEYIAIVNGTLEQKSGVIDAPIARKENSIIERCVSNDGENAVTIYEVLKSFDNLSLLKCILKTGRTHQIRVHCKFIGHPIIGDTLYGTKSDIISRQALHAYKIKFIHPINKSAVEFCAPLPDDFKKIIGNEI